MELGETLMAIYLLVACAVGFAAGLGWPIWLIILVFA